MVIGSVSQTSLQGIQRGLEGLRRNATEIASARTMRSASVPSKDLTRSIVELDQHSLQTSASVKAFRAADQMIGSLLDVKA
jgi:hypothetical protein